VQKPHCRPWQARNASCSGLRPVGGVRPSIVVTDADVGAGEAEVLAQEVAERAARVDIALDGPAVDRQPDARAHGDL